MGRIQGFGKALGFKPFSGLEPGTQEAYAVICEKLILFLTRVCQDHGALPDLPEPYFSLVDAFIRTKTTESLQDLLERFFSTWEGPDARSDHPITTFLKVAANRTDRMAKPGEVRSWLVGLVWLARLVCYWRILKRNHNEDEAMKSVNPE